MNREEPPFYVGYHAEAPPELGRFLRRIVAVILTAAVALAVLAAVSQRPFAASVFEFGRTTTFHGTVRTHPYPRLDIVRPGLSGGQPARSSYLLVAQGKHGADSVTASYDGRLVRLAGALLYRGNETMIELSEVAAQDGNSSTMAAPVEDLGVFTLVGEIVDAKCFLGAMNPGSLKGHRACAIRCLSGGAPPLLVVRDSIGVAAQLLLLTASGEPIHHEVLGTVAEPVRITGRVHREGALLFLRADPATYIRMP